MAPAEQPLPIVGSGLLLIGLLLLTWQQVYLASSVTVPGRVVELRCPTPERPSGCQPIIAYRAPGGAEYQMTGRQQDSPTAYRVGDEPIPVLVPRANPADASTLDDLPIEYGLELALVFAGLLLVSLHGAGRVRLPDLASPPPTRARAAAAMTGIASLALCSWVVPAMSVVANASLALAAVVIAAAVAVRLWRLRDESNAPQLGALAYPLGLCGVVVALGVLVVPSSWRPGLVACAPLIVASTLPWQLRLWPLLEQAIAVRRQQAARRRRLERILATTGVAPELIVQVRSVSDAHLEVVRHAGGTDTTMWALPEWFGPGWPAVGDWFLLQGPVLDPRPAPTGGGYRTAGIADWVVRVDGAESLGPDLDAAVRGPGPARLPVRALLVCWLGCLAAAILGGFALVERLPPLSGHG